LYLVQSVAVVLVANKSMKNFPTLQP